MFRDYIGDHGNDHSAIAVIIEDGVRNVSLGQIIDDRLDGLRQSGWFSVRKWRHGTILITCATYHDVIPIAGVIRSFKGEFAKMILEGRKVPKGFQTSLAKVARRKLVQLDGATTLADMAIPPGNMLEALKAGLAGRYSVRINDQWRVVFRWTAAGPEEVEIVDYHRG